MKAAAFEYARASSIEEACALLRERGDGARLIAGGQSLAPMMAMRLARPTWLVDINDVPDLQYIRVEGERLRAGACTRQRALERDARAIRLVPLLSQALQWVGHIQTRNRGTAGGSLAHADPSAELPLVACVLDAEVSVRSTRGRRALRAGDLFTGPMTTTLAADELIEEIAWPIWREDHVGSAFTEVSIRHGDFALVAAAAQVALDGEARCLRASFGVGGADATPVAFPELAQTLAGARLEDSIISTIAERAAAALDPGEDLHASAHYRRHLAKVLAERSLLEARDRAIARRAGQIRQ
ncbi:MAG: xanthine dehydrogenase family protein subunit M [Betaproteobacteria bacterium]|nr:xanthine dehydrogenase family protein subunit M [Betaproteobacteria bacterium]